MSQARLNSIREAVPVALQVCGLLGFIAAQILWLGFRRPEPEFMATMIFVATAGYIGEGLASLRGGSSHHGVEPSERSSGRNSGSGH